MKMNGTSDTMAEAPVSWTVRYQTPEGYDAMLTLRGSDVKAVMALAKTALKAMGEAGCKPQASRPAAPATANGGNGNGENAPLCPTHGKPMKKSQHGGGWYCPVKIAEDGGDGKPVYCKQKRKE
jgi:hypothetical protein